MRVENDRIEKYCKHNILLLLSHKIKIPLTRDKELKQLQSMGHQLLMEIMKYWISDCNKTTLSPTRIRVSNKEKANRSI